MSEELSIDVDVAAGEAALAAIRVEMQSIPGSELRTPNTDPATASARAVGVVRLFETDAELREKAASLPPSVFEPKWIALLRNAAVAVLYTRALLANMLPGASTARIEFALLQRATELKARMQRVLEYYFSEHSDDPQVQVVAATLRDIRAGGGYVDLASDLVRLAALHRAHRARIENDSENFRAGDPADADAAVAAIQHALSAGARADPEREAARRAWTLMVRAYDEVAATGAYLLRHREGVEQLIPPLVRGKRR